MTVPSGGGLSPSPSTTRMERRKRFRQLESDAANLPVHSGEFESGRFDVISDDSLIAIMHVLVVIPLRTQSGLELHNVVMGGARSLRSLLLTCRRMTATLTTTGKLLHKEMNARAATQIAPPATALRGPYPFTEQLRHESRSSDQLNTLREAVNTMSIHCAGPCCDGARNEFNRPKPRICTAARRSTVTASNASGEFAFVALRTRSDGSRVKQRSHNRSNAPDARMTSEWIARMNHTTCNEDSSVQLKDVDQFSAPQSMRASHDGDAVAMIRAVHAANVDESIPHSVAMVWRTSQCINGATGLSEVLEPPAEAENLGAINAQDAWWLALESDGCGLAVLWSTAYVHPMGSVVGANADNACYFIAIYCMGDNDDYEVDSYIGPFYGKAQTSSPTSSGEEVAVLVRKAPMGKGPASLATRCTVMHHIHSEESAEITHTGAISTGRAPLIPVHPHDLANCPSAVALSPSGDCVVAIHRRALTVLVEVLIRTAPSVFVSVQTIDVTHWTTIGSGEPSVFDNQGANGDALANALKLPYSIVFSPCGRFAAIVDQRPLFGLSITNYALVVLDMALRHERRGVRALPLAPVEDVAPRSLEWTSMGMWIQPRYGALLLKSA